MSRIAATPIPVRDPLSAFRHRQGAGAVEDEAFGDESTTSAVAFRHAAWALPFIMQGLY
jgi:hypothetical protein